MNSRFQPREDTFDEVEGHGANSPETPAKDEDPEGQGSETAAAPDDEDAEGHGRFNV